MPVWQRSLITLRLIAAASNARRFQFCYALKALSKDRIFLPGERLLAIQRVGVKTLGTGGAEGTMTKRSTKLHDRELRRKAEAEAKRRERQERRQARRERRQAPAGAVAWGWPADAAGSLASARRRSACPG
jgi:hypothetical protein